MSAIVPSLGQIKEASSQSEPAGAAASDIDIFQRLPHELKEHVLSFLPPRFRYDFARTVVPAPRYPASLLQRLREQFIELREHSFLQRWSRQEATFVPFTSYFTVQPRGALTQLMHVHNNTWLTARNDGSVQIGEIDVANARFDVHAHFIQEAHTQQARPHALFHVQKLKHATQDFLTFSNRYGITWYAYEQTNKQYVVAQSAFRAQHQHDLSALHVFASDDRMVTADVSGAVHISAIDSEGIYQVIERLPEYPGELSEDGQSASAVRMVFMLDDEHLLVARDNVFLHRYTRNHEGHWVAAEVIPDTPFNQGTRILNVIPTEQQHEYLFMGTNGYVGVYRFDAETHQMTMIRATQLPSNNPRFNVRVQDAQFLLNGDLVVASNEGRIHILRFSDLGILATYQHGDDANDDLRSASSVSMSVFNDAVLLLGKNSVRLLR